MSARPALQALLSELARRLGLGALGLDAEGLAAVRVDGRFVLHALAEDGARNALLYIPLGPAPEGGKATLYRRMLVANLGSGGLITLALDEASERIVLLRSIEPQAMDWPAFEQLVEELLGAAESWSENLAQASTAPEADLGQGSGLSELDIFRFGLRA